MNNFFGISFYRVQIFLSLKNLEVFSPSLGKPPKKGMPSKISDIIYHEKK